MKKISIVILVFVWNISLYAQCVTWTGSSTNSIVNTAATYLCTQNVIEPAQNASIVYNSTIKKNDLAVILYKALFPSGTAKSDYFPTPFIDIDDALLVLPEQMNAAKAMHYLDFGNGIAPFSRDYFFTNQQLSFSKKGEVVKALLEAWNITPNNSGYDPNSTSASSFYTDVQKNDIFYGYIQKAYNIGLCNNLPNSSCNTTCFESNTAFSVAQFYVMLYRLYQYQSKPTIDSTHFFYPNNFNVLNISNKGGIDRAVFDDYSDPSFNISGGGLPLSFAHSYHSDLSELPYIPDNTANINKEVYNQSLFPLGAGWMHSYNTKIISIKNFVGNSFTEQKLAIRWADGSTEVFDKVTDRYFTPSVKDEFKILTSSNGNASRIQIKKRDGTRFVFSLESALGILHLDTIADRYENKLIFTYQTGVSIAGYAPKRLFSVTDNYSNRSIYFNYASGTNYLASVSDPKRTVRYYVNSNTSDLDSFTDAKTQTTKYLYDTGVYKHLLTKIQRPNGNFITNNYFKRKLKSTQSSAYTVNVSFATNYLQYSSTTHSDVSVTQNGSTQTTSYQHNDRGNPTKIKDSLQNTQITYDAVHVDYPQVVLDSISGIYTQSSYDLYGNDTLSSTVANNIALTTKTIYGAYDLPVRSIDVNGKESKMSYNSQGSLLLLLGAEQDSTKYSVNNRGLTLSKIDPVGIQTGYYYNTYGNLDSIQILGTNISAKSIYDELSRLLTVRDPNQIFNGWKYDDNDNLSLEYFDFKGRKDSIQHLYDANDNQIQIVDAKGFPTNLGYDFDTDDLIYEKYGKYTRRWKQNEDGTLKYHITKNGDTFLYSYYPSTDSRAGLVKSDGFVNFSFNSKTKLLDTVQQIGTNKRLTYSYDGFGRTKSISYNDFPNNTVTYDYYNNGNLRFVTYPFNPKWKLEYFWDGNNRLTEIRDWNNKFIVKYSYRKNGQINSEEYANGTKNHYHYDLAGRLDSMYSVNSSGKLLCSFGAKLDNGGRHIGESQFIDKSDTTGRIYPTQILLDTFITDSTNRLTQTNTGSYISDSNGNFITDPYGGSYLWDKKGNLLKYTLGSVSKISEYDPQESRRRYDTTRFALDILGKGNVLVEMDTNGNPKALYVHGLGLVCRINVSDSSRAYYHYDFRGSTAVITNDTQKIISYLQYDEFGAIIETKPPSFRNWFCYVGKYGVMADESDRLYMRARHYIPSLGRFVGEDPVWSTNLFPYGDNNPLSNIDPDGRFVETALDVISLAQDANNFRNNPTIGAGLLVAYSGISTLVPGMPGSYALKAAKYLFQAKAVKMFSRVAKYFDNTKVNEGVYEFIANNGKKYVGQAGDIDKRIKQHIKSGKLNSNFEVIRKQVLGGKTQREIAEQTRINELGGIKNLANKRNPIGKARRYLMAR